MSPARRRHTRLIFALAGAQMLSGAAAAQQAAEPVQSANPPAAAAPAEAQPLPELEVVGKKKQAAKKKPVAQKQKPAKAVATPQAAPPPVAQEPVPEAASPGKKFDDTINAATGPVEGYVPTATTTGSKTATPITEIPQSVSVVTADRIRDQAPQALEAALRYVPGVYAEPYGFDSRGDYTTIRGTAPTQFLNGLKRGFYFYDFGKPDPFELERIEVLRGPGSMLYGQHASGGLINMISKRPQEKASGEVGVQYGSYDRRRVEFDSTGAVTDDGKWLYRVVGVAHEGDTQMDNTDNSRLLLSPSLTFRPQAGTSLTLLGHLQKDTASSSTLGFMPNSGTRVPGPSGRRIPTSTNPSNADFDKYDTENESVTVLFDHRVNDYLSVHQSARYMNFEVTQRGLYPNIYDLTGKDPANGPYLDPERRLIDRYTYATDASGDVWNSDTRAEVKANTGPVKHQILAGFDFTRYALDEAYGDGYDPTPFDLYDPDYSQPTTMPDFYLFTDSTQTARGLYLMDQMRIGPLIGIAGVRYDNVVDDEVVLGKQENSAVTKRFALIYETPFKVNPYVSYGESFDSVPASQGVFFKPVRGELMEAGVKYQPNAKTLISAAVFQLDELNRVAFGDNPAAPPRQLGATRVEGFEIEALVGVTRNFDVIASYSYTDAMIEKGDDAGTRIPFIPDHLASLWGIYKFDSGWLKGFSVGGGVRYVGEIGEDFWQTEDFTLFDAMIAYETEKWRWSLNGSNLEDEAHVASCDPRGDCFYGQRLNVTTTLTHKF